MKSLLLAFLLVISTQAMSTDCVQVAEVCLAKSSVPKDLQEFLNLEREIGMESYDINHLNQFRVYSGEGIYGNFTYQNASYTSLNALGAWAVKQMGVYDAPEYDGFEMLKTAEKMDRKAFAKFLDNALMDLEERLADIASGEREDFSVEQKAKVKRYLQIKNKSKQMLTSLVFDEETHSIVVYELLDNNNENVSDAQFIIVTDNKVILINRMWWL